MTAKKCGCNSPSCGCCEGTRKITPVSTANRPGLDQLTYRIGTHGEFFETMKARLGNMVVVAAGPDGQTFETFYPLQDLTTRQTTDPAIALLDGWATVGDVLTFYQERIANEGYLRTATERRSILELARLVGYKLRPGVAATVYLAYTLDDNQIESVEIPAGARSQSIPNPGETAQSFETSENLIARREWNNLQVRLHKPQAITFANVLFIDKLYVAGINTNLKTGDLLLLQFSDDGQDSAVRTVASIATEFEQDKTEISLQPLPVDVVTAFPLLLEFVKKIEALPKPPGVTDLVPRSVRTLVSRVLLGSAPPVAIWGQFTGRNTTGDPSNPVLLATAEFHDKLDTALEELLHQTPKTIDRTDPSEFVPELLKPKKPQAASSLQLRRSLQKIFERGTDAPAQLLVNFDPLLKETFYTAWANADLSSNQRDLKAVYVLRTQAPLFGATVTDQPTYFLEDLRVPDGNGGTLVHVKGELKTQDQWLPWPLAGDEFDNMLFLDQAHEEILPASFVLIQTPSGVLTTRQVQKVAEAQSVQRTAYGISGKTTRLTLDHDWRHRHSGENIAENLRQTLVFGQSEQLTLVDEPITTSIQVTKDNRDEGIVLDGLYNEFPSGRWVVLSGERDDIPNVKGVKGVELLMVASLRQVDPVVAGDTIHTALVLATPTAYSYKRDTLTIYGNVVKATHGETTNEPLGSGDGSQPLQSFTLKQPPLTFVPAPNATGVESSLHVYVNNVEWHEVDTVAGLGPKDRNFITKTDDADNTTLVFGNGIEGSRIPTGVLNVNSTYRKGIGKPGNVKANQISLLQTKPLGVQGVINPLAASGGADKEDRDTARENAPLAVMALDRLVSLQDYGDFTRTFAGIAKASAKQLSDGRRQFIHLTIAGVGDIPIDPLSDLYRNLLEALRKLGDVSVPVQLDSRELITLVLSANIRLQPDYLWDPVALEVRTVLLNTFGFRKRALGQPALLCEIIGAIQAVEGVAYVDVDAFGGVPERFTDENGQRQLLTLGKLADAVQAIARPPQGAPVGPSQSVLPSLAGFDKGALHAAQLAIFTPAVQDTIVLNQIK
jgi:predicted phage baseplate assembly protein